MQQTITHMQYVVMAVIMCSAAACGDANALRDEEFAETTPVVTTTTKAYPIDAVAAFTAATRDAHDTQLLADIRDVSLSYDGAFLEANIQLAQSIPERLVDESFFYSIDLILAEGGQISRQWSYAAHANAGPDFAIRVSDATQAEPAVAPFFVGEAMDVRGVSVQVAGPYIQFRISAAQLGLDSMDNISFMAQAQTFGPVAGHQIDATEPL